MEWQYQTSSALKDLSELLLRRDLDLLTEDFPYVRAHLECYENTGSAFIRLALMNELPLSEEAAVQIVAKCGAALADALAEAKVLVDGRDPRVLGAKPADASEFRPK